MLHNERGFTYPLTLCLIILFSTVLGCQIEQYVIEKRMFKETEMILKQDYYLLTTVKTLESLLATTEWPANTGTLDFHDGQAVYSVTEMSDSLWEITINLKTGSEHEIIGFAYYDTDLQKMIKWIERN